MFVCCECYVLSGRGLCDELITRPEESYRLWHVIVCDLETSKMGRPWPAMGRSTSKTKKKSLSVCNLSIQLYCIYVSYMNITLYHVMYSIGYYPQFHVTVLGLGTYYPWIRRSACILNIKIVRNSYNTTLLKLNWIKVSYITLHTLAFVICLSQSLQSDRYSIRSYALHL